MEEDIVHESDMDASKCGGMDGVTLITSTTA
jgi:hypothetical protein